MTGRVQAWTALDPESMRSEVLAGLARNPKRLPSKYFYDAVGARLFEAICRTPEYYLTRTEWGLLRRAMDHVGRLAGYGRVVIEPGSGSSDKFALLAEALRPAAYVPVEICAQVLQEAVARLARDFPWLQLAPRHGDFGEALLHGVPPGPRLIFFPGSTIGNFEPREAVGFLQRLARLAGPGGALLVGADLKKERGRLEAAYNDAEGITAAFNLNLLARLNRELGADFELDSFGHRAFFAPERGRVEMHLVSLRAQQVRIGSELVHLADGESIHTENSYKYTVEGFQTLAREGGWNPVAWWVDAEGLFSVHYLSVVEM